MTKLATTRKKTRKKNGTRQSRTALVVLGVHRSGTSVLTNLMGALGAALPKTTLRATKDNPRGYGESKVVMEFNERLLSKRGSTWKDPGFISEPYEASLEDEAARIIREEYGEESLIAIKDPRICRFPGLWIRAAEKAGYEPRVIISIRNPLEVADSLAARDQLSYSHAMLLWLSHLMIAERETRNLARVVVDYHELMSVPTSEVRRISRKLGVELSGSSNETVEKVCADVIAHELHRNRRKQEDLRRDIRVPEVVQKIYKEMRGLCREENDGAAIIPRLDQLWKESASIISSAAGASYEKLVDVVLLHSDIKSQRDELHLMQEGDSQVMEKLRLFEASMKKNLRSLRKDVSEIIINADEGQREIKTHISCERAFASEEMRSQAIETRELITNGFSMIGEFVQRIERSYKEELGSLQEQRDRLIEQLDDKQRLISNQDKRIEGLLREVERRDEELAKLQKIIMFKDKRLAELHERLESESFAVAEAKKKLEELRNRISRYKSSLSWRMTAPFRESLRWIRTFKKDARVTETAG